ncbi:hypothetical protein [Streptomyces sp. NBC_00316]|uniref:hypothetical protein n=1 Tax=Streptomyces sp. NBC_00316 TaxID=2975710 RepID=UPI002E2C357D|nr:hypothetical protein [Streptomyces sp. NBC_00316]
MVGLVFLLSACGARYSPLFIGGGASEPVIGWRECPGAERDGITEVGLYKWAKDGTADDPGELLWHIKADKGNILPHISLGEAPPGFTTRLPLTAELDAGTTYALRANMDSDDLVSGFLTFRPEQLAVGGIVFDSGTAESMKNYEGRDNEDFGCFTR